MNVHEYIVRDPAVCGGQPVFKGRRVLLHTALGYLAHGETVEHVLAEFPTLRPDHVRAAIAFASIRGDTR